MGNKPSMEDELINLKMTSRQMTSASKKSVKKEKEALSKVKKAIAQGNTEGARIYGNRDPDAADFEEHEGRGSGNGAGAAVDECREDLGNYDRVRATVRGHGGHHRHD
mmetsp:Transcript_75781/g.215906  ORF Transcript_75781/g.215906 Transcript_75781/m.215906 type:complete len:108 (-) Transcript_75781:310-633(-)